MWFDRWFVENDSTQQSAGALRDRPGKTPRVERGAARSHACCSRDTGRVAAWRPGRARQRPTSCGALFDQPPHRPARRARPAALAKNGSLTSDRWLARPCAGSGSLNSRSSATPPPGAGWPLRPPRSASSSLASTVTPAAASAAIASTRSGRWRRSCSSVTSAERSSRSARSPAAPAALVQPAGRGGVGDQVDALHLGDRLDHGLAGLARGAGFDVVREAHVLRRVRGVPGQLVGQGVLGVEVQIAEQALGLADRARCGSSRAGPDSRGPPAGCPWDGSR